MDHLAQIAVILNNQERLKTTIAQFEFWLNSYADHFSLPKRTTTQNRFKIIFASFGVSVAGNCYINAAGRIDVYTWLASLRNIMTMLLDYDPITSTTSDSHFITKAILVDKRIQFLLDRKLVLDKDNTFYFLLLLLAVCTIVDELGTPQEYPVCYETAYINFAKSVFISDEHAAL
jgi:hypothetical protein